MRIAERDLGFRGSHRVTAATAAAAKPAHNVINAAARLRFGSDGWKGGGGSFYSMWRVGGLGYMTKDLGNEGDVGLFVKIIHTYARTNTHKTLRHKKKSESIRGVGLTTRMTHQT